MLDLEYGLDFNYLSPWYLFELCSWKLEASKEREREGVKKNENTKRILRFNPGAKMIKKKTHTIRIKN